MSAMPRQRDAGGSGSPRRRSQTTSRPPAMIQRSEDIAPGGIVSSVTRIPRYVVPQIRHTAIQAKSARRRSRWEDAVMASPHAEAPAPRRGAALQKPVCAAGQPGSAVDRQHLAGDVSGMFRHEESHGVGDFVGLSPPLQRYGVDDLL